MDEPPGGVRWSTPARHVVRPEANATDDILANARERPEHPAFARRVDGAWRTVTAKQFADEVLGVAAGLMAAGIAPGDRIGLMSGTRYEWMVCDFAVWMVGAVTVTVYDNSSAAQVASVLADCAPVAVFVESERHAGMVEEAHVASVRRVWRIGTGGDLPGLVESGGAVPVERVLARRAAVRAEDLATIVYTSGTTGRPRGCMISHGNLVGQVRNIAAAPGIADTVLTPETTVLLFLPLAHVLTRVVALVAVRTGAQLACTGDLRQLAAHLREYRPSLLLAVPRVFEMMYQTPRRLAGAGWRARLFRAAEASAVAYSRGLRGGVAPWPLRLRRWAFDRLVYAKLRTALGGRAAFACSGGAPLDERLAHFLRGAGVTVLEGWGLTETTAGVTLNLPATARIGTVGHPLPGWAVRIDADGEVLVKGPGVFGGYWRDRAATREVLDADGWLRTGDLGELVDGYLRVTGRKKDLIVTASGKNVAPVPIEDRLRGHWPIDQCVLVGDRRPYLGALVTLDEKFLAGWAREHAMPGADLAALRDDPGVRTMIQAAIDEANRAVSAAEAVRRFRIVAGPFLVGDELTPMHKVRRQYVQAKLALEVEALYERGSRR